MCNVSLNLSASWQPEKIQPSKALKLHRFRRCRLLLP